MHVYPGFRNRVALVTGGSRGIGAACCRALAASGARVALTYRSDADGAARVVEDIQVQGGEAVAAQADAAKPEDISAMVRAVNDRFGSVEMLVNNAGIFEVVPHEQTDLEQWQRTLDINLTGVFQTTWAVKDAMIKNRFGRIVNISSIAGLRSRPQCIAYAVSKAGVIALTKSLADAVAGQNIRVNAVAPGLVETQMIADVDPAAKQQLVDATPISRLGRAEEIAATVMFLLSDLSDFTTGQTYVVDGGRVQLP